MKSLKWLSKLVRIVYPVSVSRSLQQGFVFIEVLPREITNVVVNAKSKAQSSARIDDTCGYKTLGDAIGDAQAIGFRLLGYIEPENLLFTFSESVEVLQRLLYRFLIANRVPYTVENLFGPISKEQRDAYNKRKPKPRAIVLCKVVDAKVFENPVWTVQQKGGEGSNCYEVSWGEVQKLQQHINESGPHELLPSNAHHN